MCLSVAHLFPAKTAARIEARFSMETLGETKNRALGEYPHPQQEEERVGEMFPIVPYIKVRDRYFMRPFAKLHVFF